MKKAATMFCAVLFVATSWGQSECGELLDSDQDGFISVLDLMNLLSYFGDSDSDLDGIFDGADACTDVSACNYLANPSEPCLWIDMLGVCGGLCLDENMDGQCDWQCGDPVAYQGYDYPTVSIDGNCWFAENLRNQNYANGDSIQDDLNNFDWSSTEYGATCIYGEGSSDCYGPCDEIENLAWHGRLYNFEAIQDPRGLCPSSWSPPSETDILDLVEYYGGESLAGPHLAAEGAWGVGTGESGLDLIPQGWRNPSGYFSLAGDYYIWTSTEGLPNESSFLRVAYQGSILVDQINQWFGMSARCIKDTEE